jgi:tRNA dimethylallyltransferase
VRDDVARELELHGAAAVHARLAPEVAAGVHPNDAKRVARLAGLARMGIDPPAGSDGLWSRSPRLPTVLVGITLDREELRERAGARAQAIITAGAQEEVRAAAAAGASRTASKALGFESLLAGDSESLPGAHRAYARRQLTWMRRMEGVALIDRTGLTDEAVAAQVVALLDDNEAR